MARQQPFEQGQRPAFQRFGQQGVVGVTDRGAGDVPCFVEVQSMLVLEQPHQLGHRDGRVGVVQLDRRLVGQGADVAVILHVAADDVLNACRREEELLPQPQFLPCRGRIRRIEHPYQTIGPHLPGERSGVIARIEGIELDRVHRIGGPQPQRVHPLALPADHRSIDRRRFDLFARGPADLARIAGHLAAEADEVGAFAPLELPRIAMREPGFGQLHLPAIVDPLAEHPVDVADAIAEGRDVETGEAFHEARSQPPQPAIAERGVRLQLLQRRQIEAVFAQRLLHLARHAKVRQCIAQQPPDQEFEAEVIDPLGAGFMRAGGGGEPVVDDIVAQGEHGGIVPVMRLGRAFVLADAVAQGADNPGFEFLNLAVRANCHAAHTPSGAHKGWGWRCACTMTPALRRLPVCPPAVGTTLIRCAGVQQSQK